jgi:hypothetical protein
VLGQMLVCLRSFAVRMQLCSLKTGDPFETTCIKSCIWQLCFKGKSLVCSLCVKGACLQGHKFHRLPVSVKRLCCKVNNILCTSFLLSNLACLEPIISVHMPSPHFLGKILMKQLCVEWQPEGTQVSEAERLPHLYPW